jgi:hypothetical protein
VRLDEWLAAHGPLSPPAALVLALRVCSTATRLSDAQLSASLSSLHSAGIARRRGEGWNWAPVASGGTARAVADHEVVERLGGLLFECLAAQPLAHRLPDADAVSRRLRALRPDLPPAVAELTAHAATAGGGPGVSLAAFAQDVRAALGAGSRRTAGGRRRLIAAGVLASAALAAAGIYGGLRGWREARVGSHALTVQETALRDITTESVDALAVIDEHTAAIRELQELEQLWFRRVELADPRLGWSRAREAWVRRLAGDRLTAEQLLEPLVPTVESALGRSHPYTRTLRLDLAAVVDARGASGQAAALRAEAAQVMTDLVRSPALAWDTVGLPWPPHTIAHVAPNVPEREGFRQTAGRGYEVPLTSTQRWFAGRDGWHLHVRATSTCRVSLVAGADPRGIGVDVRRGADGAWAAAVEGSAPQLAVASPAADTFALTLSADTDGRVTLRLADGSTHAARIDVTAPPPSPPYVLAFDDDREGAGCGVVWWEIAAR